MNPIQWLFRDEEIRKAEKKLNHQLDRIRKKVRRSISGTLVEIDVDFPENFNTLSEDISVGEVEWRDFYSNKVLDIYSVHCRMSKGSALKEHRHPNFCEYIYVISGSLVVWLDGDADGEIILPPERVEGQQPNVDGWHEIPEGISHRIQCLENDTHFVSKFLKADEHS